MQINSMFAGIEHLDGYLSEGAEYHVVVLEGPEPEVCRALGNSLVSALSSSRVHVSTAVCHEVALGNPLRTSSQENEKSDHSIMPVVVAFALSYNVRHRESGDQARLVFPYSGVIGDLLSALGQCVSPHTTEFNRIRLRHCPSVEEWLGLFAQSEGSLGDQVPSIVLGADNPFPGSTTRCAARRLAWNLTLAGSDLTVRFSLLSDTVFRAKATQHRHGPLFECEVTLPFGGSGCE